MREERGEQEEGVCVGVECTNGRVCGGGVEVCGAALIVSGAAEGDG